MTIQYFHESLLIPAMAQREFLSGYGRDEGTGLAYLREQGIFETE